MSSVWIVKAIGYLARSYNEKGDVTVLKQGERTAPQC